MVSLQQLSQSSLSKRVNQSVCLIWCSFTRKVRKNSTDFKARLNCSVTTRTFCWIHSPCMQNTEPLVFLYEFVRLADGNINPHSANFSCLIIKRHGNNCSSCLQPFVRSNSKQAFIWQSSNTIEFTDKWMTAIVKSKMGCILLTLVTVFAVCTVSWSTRRTSPVRMDPHLLNSAVHAACAFYSASSRLNYRMTCFTRELHNWQYFSFLKGLELFSSIWKDFLFCQSTQAKVWMSVPLRLPAPVLIAYLGAPSTQVGLLCLSLSFSTAWMEIQLFERMHWGARWFT